MNSVANVNVLFKTDNVYDNHHGVWMNNIPSGNLTITFGGGTGGALPSNQRYFTTTNLNLTAGTWHHVVGIIRSYNDMDIYLDCIKATGTYGGTGSTSVAYSTTGNSRIGGSIGNVTYPANTSVDGKMDQFIFWDRELTVSELTQLCDKSNTVSIDELKMEPRKLIRTVDLLGNDVAFPRSNTLYINIFDDGSTEKVFQID